MLIKNAKLRGKQGLWQILIQNGSFVEIAEQIAGNEEDVLDAGGKLVIPPYVEPHIHLDCVFTAGEPRWNESGTLFEGIELWAERKKMITIDDVKKRAKKAIQLQISQGIQFVRSHVDTTDPELTALKALLEVKKEVQEFVDLQLVAFPQEGILSFPRGSELLEQAVKLGADVVGAIPHYEFTREYGVESVKIAVALAEKYGKLVDIHCDEIDDPSSRFLETVAAEAQRLGLKERVSASHTTAMHSYNNPYAHKLFRLLQLAAINIISCPTENIHLQGRFDTFPKRRGMTRVKELVQSNINVAIAQDSIMDPWYPLGTNHPLRELDMCIHVCQMMGYGEIIRSLDLVTENGAKALRVEHEYGIEPGKPANLLILDAEDEFDAIRNLSCVLYSIRKGKVILKRIPAQTDMQRIS
ncbi:Cytosine deaminase [Propionispora sp. 2/2-37]|uniref:cytosine deaminase n=1 Tax=Propionispora sp. 2/2-37 TaxID=1677858 RepID=UPI0006BB882D|nr:cytosine deaminase [Propionispora sp. 2/2-37]CUH95383.1 Cytosine deaminase [Propionispora sp. 2/2-37]